MMVYLISVTILYPKWVLCLTICLKLQIPHYHPLNKWLLGTTDGNHLETPLHIPPDT